MLRDDNTFKKAFSFKKALSFLHLAVQKQVRDPIAVQVRVLGHEAIILKRFTISGFFALCAISR